MMPLTQETFTDQRILMLADQDLQTVIAPMLLDIAGDYFLHHKNYTMTSETTYAIPDGAIGMGIKDVWFVNPNDTAQKTLIPRMNSQSAQNNWVGQPYFTGYYIENNDIILFPQSKSGYILKIRYFHRASKMILTDDGGIVDDASTANIVLSNLPSTWEVGDMVQLTQALPGFDTITDTLEITGLPGGNVVNLVQTDSDAPTLTEADMEGNWLTLAGESVIPQIPPEAQAILAQSIASRCLFALGDPKCKDLREELLQMMASYTKSMTPRAQGQPNKVVNIDGGVRGWSALWPWPWWGGF